jgi:hypothetical protein
VKFKKAKSTENVFEVNIQKIFHDKSRFNSCCLNNHLVPSAMHSDFFASGYFVSVAYGGREIRKLYRAGLTYLYN